LPDPSFSTFCVSRNPYSFFQYLAAPLSVKVGRIVHKIFNNWLYLSAASRLGTTVVDKRIIWVYSLKKWSRAHVNMVHMLDCLLVWSQQIKSKYNAKQLYQKIQTQYDSDRKPIGMAEDIIHIQILQDCFVFGTAVVASNSYNL